MTDSIRLFLLSRRRGLWLYGIYLQKEKHSLDISGPTLNSVSEANDVHKANNWTLTTISYPQNDLLKELLDDGWSWLKGNVLYKINWHMAA